MKKYIKTAAITVPVFSLFFLVFALGWGWGDSFKKLDTAPEAKKMLLEDGCAYYAKSPKPPAGIDALYFGYDKDGKLKDVTVTKVFTTYTKVTGIITVGYKDKQVVVKKADIPDAKNISNAAKQKKLEDAVKDITGKVIVNDTTKWQNIQAVTGATRYYSKVFLNFNIMAKKAYLVLKDAPEMKKIPLKAEGK